MLNYIDLFAGSGGLSEGFCRQGFQPIAHVEMDFYASQTLKTRVAKQYLFNENKKDIYYDYLKGDISRDQLYENIPNKLLNSIINIEMVIL